MKSIKYNINDKILFKSPIDNITYVGTIIEIEYEERIYGGPIICFTLNFLKRNNDIVFTYFIFENNILGKVFV